MNIIEGRLLKIDEMYLHGELEPDSYKRLKGKASADFNQTHGEIGKLMTMDANFMKYCRYGMTLLTHLDFYYAEGSLDIKRKLIGSIFPEKLVFENGTYRTMQVNPAIELIGQFQRDLRVKGAGAFFPTEKMSGNVPFTALTSNQFAEGMRKIYDLEPLIKLRSGQGTKVLTEEGDCLKAI